MRTEAQVRATKKYQASTKGKISQAKADIKYWTSLGYATKARSAQRWLDRLLKDT